MMRKFAVALTIGLLAMGACGSTASDAETPRQASEVVPVAKSEFVTMPSLANAKFGVAQERLENLGLMVDWDKVDFKFPADTYVASTSPTSGVDVARGSTVKLNLRKATQKEVAGQNGKAAAASEAKPGLVVYEISGSGNSALSVTWTGKDFNIAQEADAELPWKKTVQFGKNDRIYASVSAQNAGSGTVACSIKIAGEVVSTNESTGKYAIVTCSGKN